MRYPGWEGIGERYLEAGQPFHRRSPGQEEFSANGVSLFLKIMSLKFLLNSAFISIKFLTVFKILNIFVNIYNIF